jgi:hypothetical protein
MAGNSLVMALRLLMLIPFLGAMGYGLLMTKFSQEMTSGEGGFATNIVTNVGAAYLDYSANRQKKAVFATGELNDERVVEIERDYQPASVQTEARAQITALAEARLASDLACKEMIASFATSCVLSGAKATILDDGMVRLTMTLSFTSDAPVGNLDGKDTEGLIPQQVALTDREGIMIAAADMPAERAKLYTQTEAACADLRAREGTCVVQSVSFEERPGKGGKIQLNARASIAYLGERATVSSMLRQLNAPAAGEQSGALDAATGFAAGLADANAALKAAEVQETPSADSLFNRADNSRFKGSQGGAKFVTPP